MELMAMNPANTNVAAPAAGMAQARAVYARLQAALARIGAALQARRQYQRDLAELYRSTDRDLHDQRINRHDIEAVCKSASWPARDQTRW